MKEELIIVQEMNGLWSLKLKNFTVYKNEFNGLYIL